MTSTFTSWRASLGAVGSIGGYLCHLSSFLCKVLSMFVFATIGLVAPEVVFSYAAGAMPSAMPVLILLKSLAAPAVLLWLTVSILGIFDTKKREASVYWKAAALWFVCIFVAMVLVGGTALVLASFAKIGIMDFAVKYARLLAAPLYLMSALLQGMVYGGKTVMDALKASVCFMWREIPGFILLSGPLYIIGYLSNPYFEAMRAGMVPGVMPSLTSLVFLKAFMSISMVYNISLACYWYQKRNGKKAAPAESC